MGTTTTNWVTDTAGHLCLLILCLLIMGLLVACQSNANYAPVTDIGQAETLPARGVYQVKAGETVYSIAWRYGLDYHDLAVSNHLDSSYHLQAGQLIRLKKPTPAVRGAMITASAADGNTWVRPARGALLKTYSTMHKGINIAGKLGDPVYAAANGRVVYAGNGLRGYGNLLIIKHNSRYLSAYAHNSQLVVKTGDKVKAGQLIAKMGQSDSSRVMLHFEVRENGKPVNPVFIQGIEG